MYRMKRIQFLLAILFCSSLITVAQTITNPVFERTDVYRFRVDKVVLTDDTTFVYCNYSAEDNSWANISENTYLEDVSDGKMYPIIKVSGIPFGPAVRNFTYAEDIQVVLYFPPVSTDKINIVENEGEEAFNIYGIDLTRSYNYSYTSDDIGHYFTLYKKGKEEGNWFSALEATQKQLEATNYVEGIRSFASACSMYNMLMVLLELNDCNKAIEFGKRIIDILQALPQDSICLDLLARAYGNVGTAYNYLKEPDISSQYMELSLATRRQMDGIGALNYEEYLNHIAVKYYYEDNYPKALLYGKEVANIYAKKFKENRYKYGCVYIKSLNNLCEYYQRMNQFEDASKVGRFALDLINDGICEDSKWMKYAVYNNLAVALSALGQVDQGIGYFEKILNDSLDLQIENFHLITNTKMLVAESYLFNKQDTLKAINIYESILKTLKDSIAIGKRNYPAYTEILYKLYKVYIAQNKHVGLDYLKRAIQIQKEWQGGESVAYANLLLELVNQTYSRSIVENNTDTLYYYLEQISNIIKRHINRSNFNMSKKERNNYWNRYKNVFIWLIPMMSHILEEDKWSALACDASLFYKGMLLESETELKNFVKLSNDSTLQQLYSNYVQDLNMLTKYNSVSIIEADVDSLESKIRNEEYQISQMVSRSNKDFKGSNYSWVEIRDALNDNDVAIEIISYEVSDSSFFYDAYVITKESEYPKLIPLFEEVKLREEMRTGNIDYQKLSNLIWGNDSLLAIIENKENIYFSPSGLLNILGIEYLPLSQNVYANEKYNLFRVSSSRELCMKGGITIKNACLYGGLDYNGIPNNHKSIKELYTLSRSVREALITRGDFEPLVGSEQEVEQVEVELVNKAVNCVVFKGIQGSEESIKSISGSEVNILHISTHGMYISDQDDKMIETNNYRFIMPNEMSYIDEEDISLSRSFLVMSGGNALIHQDIIAEESEDGILTALEISHLDFANLDLAVLSACETALGRIGAEGIFGLQRGFKKAGAHTILMSLDKVDDEATKILMVEFYRNLMSGKSKHQSLKDAQKYLRQLENGKYDKPEYWASFIMLDGLN